MKTNYKEDRQMSVDIMINQIDSTVLFQWCADAIWMQTCCTAHHTPSMGIVKSVHIAFAR